MYMTDASCQLNLKAELPYKTECVLVKINQVSLFWGI